MGGACSAYKGEKCTEGSGVNPEGTRLLGRHRHRHRCEYNIKINLVETRRKDLD
jgi:hypothetical protein